MHTPNGTNGLIDSLRRSIAVTTMTVTDHEGTSEARYRVSHEGMIELMDPFQLDARAYFTRRVTAA